MIETKINAKLIMKKKNEWGILILTVKKKSEKMLPSLKRERIA